MIPLKIQLKNFLSYGPEIQTIDFSPYPLICLSGKNGHGKSALLDAITWATWGQARKVSGTLKADTDLLRLGQTQMMVCLDFMCNGNKYRVKREYSKTYSKPINSLDFGVFEQATNAIVPLSDKTIRATQKKIEQTINFSFDSFINSAFLRQGQANEFSKKTPKERKEIFAQILGLQQYEAVRKLATERAKEASSKKSCISAFQEKIKADLERTESLKIEIKKIKQQQLEIEKKEINLFDEQKKHKTQKTKLDEQHKKLNILLFQIKELQKKGKENSNVLEVTKKEWEKVQKLQERLPNNKKLEKEKKELVDTIAKYQKDLHCHLKLKEQLLKQIQKLQNLENTFYEKRSSDLQEKKLITQKLQLEHKSLRIKIEELNSSIQTQQKEKLQSTIEIRNLECVIQKNEAILQKIKNLEVELNTGKEKYQELILQGNSETQNLRHLEQKKRMTRNNDNPCCPLCEQNLSASRKRFLQTKFSELENTINKNIIDLSDKIKKTKKSLLEKHQIIQAEQKKIETNKKCEVELKLLQKKLIFINQDIEQLDKQKNHSIKLENQIKNNLEESEKKLKEFVNLGKKKLLESSEYINIKTEHDTTINKLANLTYDEKEHKKAIQNLQIVEKKMEEYLQISEQITLQSERKKQIISLEKSIKTIKIQKNNIQKNIDQYSQLPKKEKNLQNLEQKNIQNIAILKKEKENLLQKKGSFDNQKQKLEELEKEYLKQQKNVCKLDEISKDLHEIAEATSKNGIQALLIENAIPEIEQEANRLLSRLTNNQAQIFIESLRDLKKGGTKETLDIKISDAAGIRSYEMFSGGEAFRIDFALRIAISKLLARRSGTSLQTLIIDEGFGSQDEEGLSHIMNALYKIQDDFLKVIVVSHLNSMKNQFPVHFLVQKDSHGSKVNIVELS